MGFFAFDGKNIIFDDLVSKLPDGRVYFKEQNIIPFIDNVTFVENFGPITDIPVGTDVNVYIDGDLYETKKTIDEGGNSFIYSRINSSPYGKFNVRTEIAGQVFNDQVFYAINIFAFYVVIAKTYNFDYTELFKLFGNLFYNTTQNDILEDMYGWYFDFFQGSLTIAEYRRALVGDLTTYLGTVRSFVNYSITLKGIEELIKSFTGNSPTTFAYRNYDGFIIREAGLTQIWNFSKYWLVNSYTLTGSSNIIPQLANFPGKTFKIRINECTEEITFSLAATTVDQIEIELQAIWKNFTNLVDVGGGDTRIVIKAVEIEIISGTALALFGLAPGIYTNNIVEDSSNKRAILMSKRFKLYTLRIWIPTWPYDEGQKIVMERLISHIVPIGLKYEIIYDTSGIWCPT